ncbi:hydrogenase maturation nickel metallochaperone HypA [Sporolactobacillus sp. Y61]|jgi:hydrogenase nickel incorporation protein HypA/HybF|uniref:Hydrogenase maturation factor HypA n=1 Tax=Sporolactobacillus sp. Y61 TaxID=3160863 RepID=A0AAU8IBH8_9BACL|nr:hydrogenase maturation nickel metallochaperone HypA [Sporolactobacillus sp. THM19-2]RYL93612.1 hydrogenase maturation nickel metallochaperone HypA [Sporolactobacillus sp. THM19-2]
MHEMGLMADALEAVAADAEKRGMSSVEKISLIVGDLSNVLPDALRFAFDAFRRTGEVPLLDPSASLTIIRERGRARCAVCHTEYEPDELIATCPKCGMPFGVLLEGETFKIQSYEGS